MEKNEAGYELIDNETYNLEQSIEVDVNPEVLEGQEVGANANVSIFRLKINLNNLGIVDLIPILLLLQTFLVKIFVLTHFYF